MDYYEKCCYQNIDYRYLIIYIYTISNTSSFEMNWVFFGGGPKLSPLIKHWVGGPFTPASYALCGH